MRAALNPFSPGSGLRPPALVGRNDELETLATLIERSANGLNSRGIVLNGLRGVGKTVLLNEMRARAEDAGWFVVTLEARPDDAGQAGARQTLAREISAQARQLRSRLSISERVKKALGAVTAFNVTLGTTGIDLGVEVAVGRADSGSIEIDLPELVQDLCAALAEDNRSFGLFIDELQDLDRDLLSALLATQHQSGQRGWPFYLISAGLPHLPGILADVRSYAERLFDYCAVTRLPRDVAAAAFVEPLTPRGVSIAAPALQLLVDASDGYPYFIQEFGRAAWEVSPGPQIEFADARDAVALGLERLDQGFFRSRWERATPAERRMLIAMALDVDGPSSSSDVARRMELAASSLGPYRARLIQKGLVYSPEHGRVAFTVPGMAEFVHRHREEIDAPSQD